MKKSMSVVLLCITVLAGCAGADFDRIPNDELRLGVDTKEDIKAKLGKPYMELQVVKNKELVDSAGYTYSSYMGSSAYENVWSVKGQTFFFFNGKLVGSKFTSTLPDNLTDFDPLLISQIKKGATTKQEVHLLLGESDGEHIYPLIEQKNTKADVYFYSQSKSIDGVLDFYYQNLVISYDRNGVVSNINYEESGVK